MYGASTPAMSVLSKEAKPSERPEIRDEKDMRRGVHYLYFCVNVNRNSYLVCKL